MIWLKGLMVLAVCLALMTGAYIWNQRTHGNSLQDPQGQSQDQGRADDLIKAGDVCGVIRKAFLESSSSTWTFTGCRAVSPERLDVSVRSGDRPREGGAPAEFTAENIPPAMAETFCGIFFRGFDNITAVDFHVTDGESKGDLLLFHLDRQICGSRMRSVLDGDPAGTRQ